MIRVATFNVRLDAAVDGADAWPHRRRLVAGTIRYHAPDVIGVQEPLDHQLRELATLLPEYEWVGDSRGADESAEHTAVGYRTDRFDRRGGATFHLSETPDEPGPGWDATHPRVATWVRLADDDGEVVLLNTHLDHEGPRARLAGAELVAERLAGHAGSAPALLTGDMNCLAGDPPHAALDGAPLDGGRELRPAAEVATHRHGPDTSRTDFHDLLPDRRIDHVFASDDLEVRSHAVVTDRDDDRYPSDHLPVVVDLTR